MNLVTSLTFLVLCAAICLHTWQLHKVNMELLRWKRAALMLVPLRPGVTDARVAALTMQAAFAQMAGIDTPGSSNGRTGDSESRDAGSIPAPGSKS